MPRRNLYLLAVIALVSLACYKKADSAYRSHYRGMLETILKVFEEIDHNYIREVDDRQVFEGAIKGMVDRLEDPYSAYEPPQEKQETQESLEQKFGGIGIELAIDPTTKRLTVMTPMIGKPAYNAGVLAGDQLLAIDGEDTTGFGMDDAVHRLRGKPGKKVTLTVLHAGQSEGVEIERRSVIDVPSVLGDWRDELGRWQFVLADDPRIGYLRVNTFGEQTVRELRSALEELTQRNVQALVVDLRGNAGGYLSAAIGTCDLFVKEGEIVSIRGRETQPVDAAQGGTRAGSESKAGGDTKAGGNLPDSAVPGRFKDEQRHVASGEAGYTAWPMAVLVNRQSASASEIVAACLQDHERAIVVGERTWGKGTVQNVIPLEGGKSALRLTIASFWRPSDKNIHRFPDTKEDADWGVRPNEGFEVKLTDDERRKVFEDRRSHDAIQQAGAADPGYSAARREEHSAARREEHSAARREEHSAARREEHSAARREEHSAARREEHGAARREEHGAARREEHGAARREEHSAARREEHSAARREEHGAARREEHSAARREEHGAARREEHGAARREEHSAARREEHGAARREEHSAARREKDRARGFDPQLDRALETLRGRLDSLGPDNLGLGAPAGAVDVNAPAESKP